MSRVTDISITRHKVRATVIGISSLGKFWLYAQYGTDVIRIDDFVAVQLFVKNLEEEVKDMVEDGLKVVMHEST